MIDNLFFLTASEHKIYKYNPSKVFINLGYVDLVNDKSVNEIISNYEEIIKNIKLNRPYAEIYVISVFPINNDYDETYLFDYRFGACRHRGSRRNPVESER